MKHNLVEVSILISLISFVTLALLPAFVLGRPNWLNQDTFMTYEQEFSWPQHSETTNMAWQITKIEGNYIEINANSCTIDDSLSIIPVSTNFTINSDTRKITECTEDTAIGYKWYYWIETNMSTGQTADTGFFNASIGESENLNVLGQQRDTWMLEHDWSDTTYMKRWYDKTTGIVLKIQVGLERAKTQIQITETVKWTNINLLPSQPSPNNQSPPIWIWLATLAFAIAVVLIGIAVAMKIRRSRKNQKSSPTN